MKLKINIYEFDVSNKDIILDNGKCYQCLTLKHHRIGGRSFVHEQVSTIMSKKQFNDLVNKNQIVLLPKDKYPKTYERYTHGHDICKIWRFNVDEKVKEE